MGTFRIGADLTAHPPPVIYRLIFIFLAAGLLGGCRAQQVALTPPAPVRTVVANLQTEQARTPERTQQVVVPPEQRTANARATAIRRGATSEAQARIHQTQTGPPPTATPEPAAPTWTAPAVYTPWWESTPRPEVTPTPHPPLQPYSIPLPEVLLYLDNDLIIHPGGRPAPDYPPDLVLYGDGTLVKANRSFSRISRPTVRQLEREEMCSLLNTVDQLGFLELETDTYLSPVRNQVMDQVTLMVRGRKPVITRAEYLDAWMYGMLFESFLDACQDFGAWGYDPGPNFYCYMPPPEYPLAFLRTYQFLRSYDPGGMKPMEADRLVVWVLREEDSGESSRRPWPLEEPSLREVYLRARTSFTGSGEGWYSFVVSDPAWVDAFWENLDTGVYTQDGMSLFLSVRPLWPEEDVREGFVLRELVNPRPNAPVLECTPEDGTVPLYWES